MHNITKNHMLQHLPHVDHLITNQISAQISLNRPEIDAVS